MLFLSLFFFLLSPYIHLLATLLPRYDFILLVDVLEWSGQPYGSAWVHRQTMQYLLEVICAFRGILIKTRQTFRDILYLSFVYIYLCIF